MSAGDVPLEGREDTPRPLTVDEIKRYIGLYATAAANAVHRAGFDGVEIHGANGYLPDQFLQTVTNNRTDEYGGSIENRLRFTLEVVDAVVAAVGQRKVGLRVSPWSSFAGMYVIASSGLSRFIDMITGMGMSDPKPTFAALFTRIRDTHPDLAYLHVVEPRVNGYLHRDAQAHESNDFLREIWKPRPFMSAGGYDREHAIEAAESTGDLISFGRLFISNVRSSCLFTLWFLRLS